MSVRKEAVIFVPAMTAPEKDFYLNYLSAGLTEQIESRSIKVKEVGEAKIAGSSGKSFEVYFDKEKVKTLDIYEVYWGDLFSRLSEKDLKTKILSGTHLAFYWFFF